MFVHPTTLPPGGVIVTKFKIIITITHLKSALSLLLRVAPGAAGSCEGTLGISIVTIHNLGVPGVVGHGVGSRVDALNNPLHTSSKLLMY